MLTPNLYKSASGEHDGAVGDATLRMVVFWGLLVGPTLVGGVIWAASTGVPGDQMFDTVVAKVIVGVWGAGLAHQWFSARASILMAEERNGSIGVLKAVAAVFFVMAAWQCIRAGQLGDLKPVALVVESVFLVFAGVHVSLCVTTGTRMPTTDVVVLLVSAATTAGSMAFG